MVDSLAFRRLLADCLTFSLHRVVALAHSLDLVRDSLSDSMLCEGPLRLTSFLSTSLRSSSFLFRLHSRITIMKTTMTAARTRDRESITVVRKALFSDVLDQPGGSRSVSLVGDGVGVVARSSTGVGPEVSRHWLR